MDPKYFEIIYINKYKISTIEIIKLIPLFSKQVNIIGFLNWLIPSSKEGGGASSFTDIGRRQEPALSKYVWKIKEKCLPYQITWKTAGKTQFCNLTNKYCRFVHLSYTLVNTVHTYIYIFSLLVKMFVYYLVWLLSP